MNDDTATLKGIPFNPEKHVNYAEEKFKMLLVMIRGE